MVCYRKYTRLKVLLLNLCSYESQCTCILHEAEVSFLYASVPWEVTSVWNLCFVLNSMSVVCFTVLSSWYGVCVFECPVYYKGKVIPLQAWCGPEGG